MAIKPIHNERDHRAALAEIERLMGRELDRGEEDRLEVLATLVEVFERERHALGLPADPIEALKAHMASSGRTQADLARLLGSRSRASEILHGKGRLSMTAIRALHEKWGLPAEILLVRPATAVAERPAAYRARRTAKRRGTSHGKSRRRPKPARAR